ncbi:MAG: polyphosphate kinase 2 family protein [Polyangiaceae bacterium]|jgi:PPK2 family polyphosphate:nucleotide phosphotransferase
MDYRKRLIVEPGSQVDLSTIDPDFKDDQESKSSADEELAKHARRLADLQYLMYAENRRSLLICLQGLDAAGKDGTIRHVLGAMNPQGARAHAFKTPSTLEASHDFLWRAHEQSPARGEIVVFNRSHYEDVLVVRVHSLVPKDVWSKRYDLINAFEANLVQNGTHILKFFLHISEDEQLRRYRKRLDDPRRHWKVSEADYSERMFWSEYVKAYDEALSKTSTKHAPWFVVPANHKWFRNLAISTIIVDHLESFKMKTPPPKVDLEQIRRKYHAAERDERRNGK